MLLNYAFIYRGSQRYILFLSVGVKHCNLFLLPAFQSYWWETIPKVHSRMDVKTSKNTHKVFIYSTQ